MDRTSDDGENARQEVEYPGRRPVADDGDDVSAQKQNEATEWKQRHPSHRHYSARNTYRRDVTRRDVMSDVTRRDVMSRDVIVLDIATVYKVYL